jgi:hypothetical protein
MRGILCVSVLHTGGVSPGCVGVIRTEPICHGLTCKSRSTRKTAQRLGARWDPRQRVWYVPAGVDAAPLQKWCPPSHAEHPVAAVFPCHHDTRLLALCGNYAGGCRWDGSTLVLVADNYYDHNGESLADEFADTVAAYAPGTPGYRVRVLSAASVQ